MNKRDRHKKKQRDTLFDALSKPIEVLEIPNYNNDPEIDKFNRNYNVVRALRDATKLRWIAPVKHKFTRFKQQATKTENQLLLQLGFLRK